MLTSCSCPSSVCDVPGASHRRSLLLLHAAACRCVRGTAMTAAVPKMAVAVSTVIVIAAVVVGGVVLEVVVCEGSEMARGQDVGGKKERMTWHAQPTARRTLPEIT